MHCANRRRPTPVTRARHPLPLPLGPHARPSPTPPSPHPSPHPAAQLFPGSDWVTCAAAAAHYNMRNFDEAQRLYEDLLSRDPHRVEVGSGSFPFIARGRGRPASLGVGRRGLLQRRRVRKVAARDDLLSGS